MTVFDRDRHDDWASDRTDRAERRKKKLNTIGFAMFTLGALAFLMLMGFARQVYAPVTHAYRWTAIDLLINLGYLLGHNLPAGIAAIALLAVTVAGAVLWEKTREKK